MVAAVSTADTAFERLANRALDDILAFDPELATGLGDHRYDDRLTDTRPEAYEEHSRILRARLAELDALTPNDLSADNRVDREILRTALRARLFDAEELREQEWNPLLANPGTAIYLLLARDFAPLPDRLRSLAGRLAAVPATLDAARRTLRDMPRVHIETALVQFGGTADLLGSVLERALEAAPALRGEIQPLREEALQAIAGHREWLATRLAEANRDPRIGPERLAAKLALTLDSATDADAILARAEDDLGRVTERMAELAARMTGRREGSAEQVREVLDSLAAEHLDDATLVPFCTAALAEATEFVRERDLVTVYDDPVEVIVMPEIHRGVTVAYCDQPGPLETRRTATFFAVSPAPADWPAQRIASYYREYNVHMTHNLTVHEAMPGHVVQLSHANRCNAPTLVRATLWSGSFVEGWAVYAEELMADRGYRGDANDALRMQQLKMQLRTIINAILDVRVHAHGMTEDEAMALMTVRGMQEEGEAAGKWRRALLTSAQLSTYYVGYTEVSGLVRDLRAARPGASDREVHDAMLAHGSPPPRHLRALLGL